MTATMNYLAQQQNPKCNLATFTLDELAQFKHEGVFDTADSTDFRNFYVGRDDVHGVMKYLLARTSRSLCFNMFGYADDELDQIIQNMVLSQNIYVQGTLDSREAGSVHEKKILATWSDAVRASIVPGRSATNQISHTKGGVCDGKIGFNGSTNWSASGEGTFVQSGGPGGKGYKAQNNTLTIFVNPVEVANFIAELNEEHSTVLQQQAAKAAREANTTNTAGVATGTTVPAPEGP